MSIDLGTALLAIQKWTAQRDKNDLLYTYTIFGFDQSPYLTRTLFPRVGDVRPILHYIHRPDADPHLHNHPWKTAEFVVLTGGYTEERLVDGRPVERTLRPGDSNRLDAETFHRVSSIEPDTWTFGIVGERVQTWGFLVDGEIVPFHEYFALRGHVAPIGGMS